MYIMYIQVGDYHLMRLIVYISEFVFVSSYLRRNSELLFWKIRLSIRELVKNWMLLSGVPTSVKTARYFI